MAKNTRRDGDFLVYDMHLIFDRSGGVRVTRGEGALDADERAMALQARLPLSLFAIPNLRATLTVSHEQISPDEIDVEAAQEALRGALKGDVRLEIVTGEEPE